jgi:hypothetical protein
MNGVIPIKCQGDKLLIYCKLWGYRALGLCGIDTNVVQFRAATWADFRVAAGLGVEEAATGL